jgi:hypothetical protein
MGIFGLKINHLETLIRITHSGAARSVVFLRSSVRSWGRDVGWWACRCNREPKRWPSSSGRGWPSRAGVDLVNQYGP